MGRNCLTCGKRQYVIETVWDETKEDNVINIPKGEKDNKRNV